MPWSRTTNRPALLKITFAANSWIHLAFYHIIMALGIYINIIPIMAGEAAKCFLKNMRTAMLSMGAINKIMGAALDNNNKAENIPDSLKKFVSIGDG